jgi:hypothetical protein
METWIVFHNTANERNRVHGVASGIDGILKLVPVGSERYYRAEKWIDGWIARKLDSRELSDIRNGIGN